MLISTFAYTYPEKAMCMVKYQTQVWSERNHYEPSAVSLQLYLLF